MGGAGYFLNVPREDVPLLYATTSGAPYERAEFEQVGGIEWPYGGMAFKVRLLAGDTVVEQPLFTSPTAARARGPADGLGTDIAPTAEDSQPVVVSHHSFEGAPFAWPSCRMLLGSSRRSGSHA